MQACTWLLVTQYAATHSTWSCTAGGSSGAPTSQSTSPLRQQPAVPTIQCPPLFASPARRDLLHRLPHHHRHLQRNRRLHPSELLRQRGACVALLQCCSSAGLLAKRGVRWMLGLPALSGRRLRRVWGRWRAWWAVLVRVVTLCIKPGSGGHET